MKKHAGHTIVEIVVALAVLAIALGATALVGLRSQEAVRTESVRARLDGQAREVISRLTRELRAAGSDSVTALPESPTWDSALTFDQVSSISQISGAIGWTTSRLELRYEAGELNDGVDNNSNGVADEGRVVLIRDWGGAATETTLTHWVREYAEGEIFNGLDDNGNGLVDERGLSFERSATTLTVRLTLERPDAEKLLVTRSAETSVLLRN